MPRRERDVRVTALSPQRGIEHVSESLLPWTSSRVASLRLYRASVRSDRRHRHDRVRGMRTTSNSARSEPRDRRDVRAVHRSADRGRPGRFQLHRAASARPGGTGGRPQAPGHVHRLDGQPRSDALPVGDHRQLRRRGPGRLLRPYRGDPPRRRFGGGPRQRPRHPGGRGAQDRPVRRRGRDDQAARRRQVRRRLLRGLRRSARRRRLRGQRPVRPAGRRGRPQQQDPLDQLPPRRARHLHRIRPRRSLRSGQRPAQGQAHPQDPHRHARAVLGRSADLPQGRQALPGDAARPCPPDRLPGARPDPGRARRARPGGRGRARGDLPLRRRHQRVLRIPRPGQGRVRRPGCCGWPRTTWSRTTRWRA